MAPPDQRTQHRPVVRRRGDRAAKCESIVERLESRTLFAGGLDPSLTAWFKADAITATPGAAVATWADSSGMGFNASQPNASQRPTYLANAINGHAAVHFNAASSSQLAFSRPVSGDFTIVVVFRSLQGLAHDLAWFDGAGLVDGEVSGVTNDFGVSLNAFGQVLGGTGNPDTFAPSGLGFNDDKPHVATLTRTASTGSLSMYVDGRLFKTVTGGTQALTAPSRMTIGSLQTNLNYFTGDIAEMQIYSAALPDAVRAADEAQLEATYNIAPSPATWFTNPVLNLNFPDPGVLQVNGTYYAYATNGNGRNVQTQRSTDLVHWTAMPDALPNLPPWAQTGKTWAPDAALASDGSHYNLYFTAANISSGRQAIGVATSANPGGPYSSSATAPLVSQATQGGAIDPSVFTASDGSEYLLWKNDGNAINSSTFIYIQRLSADGLSLVGSPKALTANDQTWEGRVVEAPVLWQHGGKYFLFYSANSFDTSSYAIGYALSSTLMGSYIKPAQPLVKSENGVVGPGGEEIVIGPDGNTWMLYHSWENNFGYRSVSIDRLSWNGDIPIVRGPSRSPQPQPVHPTVQGRFTIYDILDPAPATDKQALLPGQTATGLNLTGYMHGLVAIAVDVSNLPAEAALTAADFTLKAGGSSNPALWAAAPTPASITVRRGGGVNGSDRITLTWANDTIVNEWLSVTLKADANTALASADGFYFGNLVGDTGNDTGPAAVVSALDLAAVRTAAGQPVTATTPADINKDGAVDATDAAIVRANLTHSLVLLTAAAAPAAATAATVSAVANPDTTVATAQPGATPPAAAPASAYTSALPPAPPTPPSRRDSPIVLPSPFRVLFWPDPRWLWAGEHQRHVVLDD